MALLLPAASHMGAHAAFAQARMQKKLKERMHKGVKGRAAGSKGDADMRRAEAEAEARWGAGAATHTKGGAKTKESAAYNALPSL